MSNDVLDVLPVSLDLIRIPRDRVTSLVHPILRQLLAPEPTFLALTANEVELSIFAVNAAAAFAPVIRRDRRRQSASCRPGWEPVEISTNKWKVIQIPSPDDSGAHLHEVSAPIAAAGISILYHSSHQSDFIFVKDSRLHEVLILLAGVGFTPLEANLSPGTELSLGPTSGAVLTRCHSTSVSPTSRSRSNTNESTKSFASVAPALERAPEEEDTEADSLASVSQPSIYAPTSAEVRLLAPELTCIGLPNKGADAWVLKLIKLVAFPDLIDPTKPLGGPLDGLELELDSPFVEFDASDSASPDMTPESSDDEGDLVDGADFDSCLSGVPSSLSPKLTEELSCIWCGRKYSQPGVHSCSCSNVGPAETPPAFGGLPSSLLPSENCTGRRPSLPHRNTLKSSAQADIACSLPLSLQKPRRLPTAVAVPFFSFTRAPEGSSLTGPVAVLASLFPLGEREGLSCVDALDGVDGYDQAAQPRVCLQIDLRRCALDSHGLVHRFTTALAEHAIEHVYSSTFKTANILVGGHDAIRARALLALC